MKYILEHELGFLGSWVLQINPKKQIRVRQQCRHQELFDVLAVQASLRCKCERPNHLSHLSHPLWRVKLARMLWRIVAVASSIELHPAKSSKFQAPSSEETPSFKLKDRPAHRSHWHLFLGFGNSLEFGFWCLVFGVWSLVFGVRCSVFCSTSKWAQSFS